MKQPRRTSPRWRRDSLIEILDELIELSDASELSDISPYPDPEKAKKSRSALIEAGRLIGPLIGWAIDHQAGMLLSQTSMPFWTIAGHDGDPMYARARENANARKHEEQGAAYDLSNMAVNRAIVALLLSTLIESFIGTDRKWWELAHSASEALLALNQGEERPFLHKTRSRRKGAAYTQDLMRDRACGHIAFRAGKGEQLNHAIKMVAAKYGLEEKTVAGWWEDATGPSALFPNKFRTDLARRLGNTHCERMKEAADSEGRRRAGQIGSEYSDQNLERDGGAYKRARAAVRKARPKRGKK